MGVALNGGIPTNDISRSHKPLHGYYGSSASLEKSSKVSLSAVAELNRELTSLNLLSMRSAVLNVLRKCEILIDKRREKL
ncbi:hypothetical protein D2E26_0938 [Bifidobacterium dolichotidis]|uniref:Uncharacterized protein n=1 Tax=Bifidobacterium dolichotidis TaxID=2306976 RepID=A0A430FQ14_9BIFI|nr:hypothetical protein D2E26_0938 [Bifidobacterium dolichotidis]